MIGGCEAVAVRDDEPVFPWVTRTKNLTRPRPFCDPARST